MEQETIRNASVILIVENSPVQAKIIGQHIEACTRFSTLFCPSLAELGQILDDQAGNIFLAVCNLNLKDAPDGEAVDHVLSRNIPCVILTTTFDDAIRNRYLEKNVLDYLNKSDPGNMDAMVDLIERIDGNRSVTVLLAEDNGTVRAIMKKLLLNQNFQVLEAANGQEALDLMKGGAEPRLVITDYEMPKVDGLQLIAALRENHPKDRLSIIGVSAHNAGSLTARFLKNGANDFLKKPFEVEEFNCRVNKNIAEVERIQAIKEAFQKDPLTGVCNLKFFMESGPGLFGRASCLILVRVDGLMDLNAAHGWAAGDAILKRAAALIEQNSDGLELTARSGDSFYALTSMDAAKALSRLELVLQGARESLIRHGADAVKFTLSCGMAPGKPALDAAMAAVQQALARPGANRIVRA